MRDTLMATAEVVLDETFSSYPAPARLRLAVGIATRGRPAVLAEMIAGLNAQSRKPDTILISYAQPADIGDAAAQFPEVRFLQSAAGLTRQRNTVLEALIEEDVVLFLDDDFCLDANYLAVMEQVFLDNPGVTVATGAVKADGINGTGYTFAQARAIVAAAAIEASSTWTLTPVFNGYGCNMALRLAPIRAHRLRFDQELPLYGWYEDVEFSRQLAAYGQVVRVEEAFGVHLGVKSGRQSGVRLGYSQVANPVYLARRRRVSWTYAIASMVSRSMKNLVFSARPEPMIDRRGRLKSNLKGWTELLRGSIHPTRILEL